MRFKSPVLDHYFRLVTSEVLKTRAANFRNEFSLLNVFAEMFQVLGAFV